MQVKPWVRTSLILLSETATLAAVALGVYVWSLDLREIEARRQVIAAAQQMIGKPYIWGAASPRRGFDCSGLVKYTHKQSHINLPRTSLNQFRHRHKVALNELQPGDLVFFKTRANRVSHVGIYLGDKRFIHAPRKGKTVRVSSLDSSFWKKRYAGAGNYYAALAQ